MRVNYVTPGSPRARCFDECFGEFQGCMQGCGMNDHDHGGCQIGCEGFVKICREGCIDNTPPN